MVEVSTALPYRVGDNVKSRSNSFIATIDAIEEKTHNDINKLGSDPDCADQL